MMLQNISTWRFATVCTTWELIWMMVCPFASREGSDNSGMACVPATEQQKYRDFEVHPIKQRQGNHQVSNIFQPNSFCKEQGQSWTNSNSIKHEENKSKIIKVHHGSWVVHRFTTVHPWPEVRRHMQRLEGWQSFHSAWQLGLPWMKHKKKQCERSQIVLFSCTIEHIR